MWLKALVLLTLIGYVAAQCNVCQSASNVACHSETTFSICYDGVPSYDLLPCPKDFYCTDGFYTCYENADPVCQTENDSTTTEIQTTTTTAIPTTTTTTEIPTTTVTTEIPTTTITTEIPTTTVTTEIPTTTPTTTTTTEIPNTTTTTEIPTTTPTSTTTTEIPTTTTTTEIPTTTTTTEIPTTTPTTTTTTEIPTTTPTTTTTTEIPTTTTTTETPTTTSTEAPWDADDICQQYSKNTFFENVDDPTCTTFITCTVDADGTHSTKVTSCKANQYFSTSLKVCTATRPDGCVEETTTVDTTTPTTTTVSTTTPTTTTVTTTTASTTTAEPWSAEATCLTVTKTTLFQNQDDPTCTTYLYCYVFNGSATALIKNCKTNQYYDVSLKACTDTKPDYCT